MSWLPVCDEIQLFNHRLVLSHCRLFCLNEAQPESVFTYARGLCELCRSFKHSESRWIPLKRLCSCKGHFCFLSLSELFPYVRVRVGRELDSVWNKTNSRFRYPGRGAKYFLSHSRKQEGDALSAMY